MWSDVTSSVVCRPLTGDVTEWTSAAIILKKHLWCNNWLGIVMDQFMDLYRGPPLDDYGESQITQRSKKSAARVTFQGHLLKTKSRNSLKILQIRCNGASFRNGVAYKWASAASIKSLYKQLAISRACVFFILFSLFCVWHSLGRTMRSGVIAALFSRSLWVCISRRALSET